MTNKAGTARELDRITRITPNRNLYSFNRLIGLLVLI
jgi:hypothetical protein